MTRLTSFRKKITLLKMTCLLSSVEVPHVAPLGRTIIFPFSSTLLEFGECRSHQNGKFPPIHSALCFSSMEMFSLALSVIYEQLGRIKGSGITISVNFLLKMSFLRIFCSYWSPHDMHPPNELTKLGVFH